MRAKYRKPRRRRGGTLGWNVVIAVVVLFGIGGIVLTRAENSTASAAHPRAANQAANVAGDHWHTFLGVDVCGEWLPNAPGFETAADNPNGTNVGIHSHGDGLIHTHPFFSSEEGSNATVGKFMTYGGWSLSSDSMQLWSGPTSRPTQTSWNDGDKCTFGDYKGKAGHIVWTLDGKLQSGNPANYRQQDGTTVAVGFLPKGAKLPFPPDACSAFANITDQTVAAVVDPKSPCLATDTTTVPPSSAP